MQSLPSSVEPQIASNISCTPRSSVISSANFSYFDTKGARLCGVDFVGVEYGYGDLESMKKEGGRVFVKTTAELLDVLTK